MTDYNVKGFLRLRVKRIKESVTPEKKKGALRLVHYLLMFGGLLILLLFYFLYEKSNSKEVSARLSSQRQNKHRPNTLNTDDFSNSDEKVYICLTHYAYAYHKTNKCIGLRNCGGALKLVGIDNAVLDFKRTPCEIEYPE